MFKFNEVYIPSEEDVDEAAASLALAGVRILGDYEMRDVARRAERGSDKFSDTVDKFAAMLLVLAAELHGARKECLALNKHVAELENELALEHEMMG